MSNIVFDDEMGRIQRAIAETHDLVVRRNIFMDALNLRTGERVLELGCGGGSYAVEAAQFVGPTGHIAAIDISADQIAAARDRCGRFAWVECQTGTSWSYRIRRLSSMPSTASRCSNTRAILGRRSAKYTGCCGTEAALSISQPIGRPVSGTRKIRKGCDPFSTAGRLTRPTGIFRPL